MCINTDEYSHKKSKLFIGHVWYLEVYASTVCGSLKKIAFRGKSEHHHREVLKALPVRVQHNEPKKV